MDAQNVSWFLALGAGVLSFVSPCVLPLVPAYVGYLSGATVTPQGAVAHDRRATTLHALSFVLGFATVFTLLGASVGLVGYLLYDWLPLIQKGGGVILVLFGLHTMRLLNIPWLNYEKRLNWQANPEWGYASSFFVGSIFAAGWTPCVGLILSGILLLASASQTVGQGAALLFVYSLGLGIPFLLTGLALNRMSGLLRRLNRRQNVISIFSGLFLIGMGVLVYTNFLSIMSGYFYRYVGTFL